jgi:hypothetical protein
VLIFGEKVATENFYFSLKIGANYSVISDVDEGSNRTGLNFGLVNNIKLTDKLFLTPEFLPISARGVKDVPILTTGDPDLDSLLVKPVSTDRKLNYLDIPILFRYQVSKRFLVSVGPQISILTSATDTYRSSPINDVELTTEIDILDALNRLDVAAVLDLSFILAEPKNGKGVNAFIRVSQGFIDISKDDSPGKFTNFTLQAGASFPFIETPSN